MNNSRILPGWRLVLTGRAYAGDRYWDARRLAWLPVTPGRGGQVRDYVAVIRRNNA